MSSLAEHQAKCESEDCECQQVPVKGECLYDRQPSGNGHFCSDLCAMRYAQERGIPYVEDNEDWREAS